MDACYFQAALKGTGELPSAVENYWHMPISACSHACVPNTHAPTRRNDCMLLRDPEHRHTKQYSLLPVGIF